MIATKSRRNTHMRGERYHEPLLRFPRESLPMVMPPCGTFAYVAIVPNTIDDGAFECAAESREAVANTGHHLVDRRLVGLAPVLTMADASLPARTHGGRPEVMRSRVTLTARTPEQATVAMVSFYLSKRLTLRLAPGDVIHLGRTSSSGLGVSVVRSGRLVVAAGAVASVPLGHSASANTPSDLIAGAKAVFRRHDPKFEFMESPLEVTVEGSRAILFRGGRRELGPFDIEVLHGFIPGIPGTDECAAIARRDVCSIYAAVTSATWLEDRSLFSMADW